MSDGIEDIASPYNWTAEDWQALAERAVKDENRWADEHGGSLGGTLTTTDGWMAFAAADAVDTLARFDLTEEQIGTLIPAVMIGAAVAFVLGRQFQRENPDA